MVTSLEVIEKELIARSIHIQSDSKEYTYTKKGVEYQHNMHSWHNKENQ